MVVNSIVFLIFFVFVFLFYYFPLKEKTKAQNLFLLAASYFFYGYADLKMLPLLIISTLVYFYLGIWIKHFNVSKNDKKASLLMTLGIVYGIVLLLYFKYLNFFLSSFSDLFESLGLHTNIHTFNIVLPLGISFFTFRLISYIIEINRGTIEPSYNVVTFGTYIAFFPCLLSGPIDRPQEFIPQLEHKRLFNYNLAIEGLKRILWGAFKKMVIADNIAIYVDTVWNGYSSMNGSSLILALILYSFQIYADFSGYSDMAIGIGQLLGFKIRENFNRPYFARSASEFWRKWHMSLTSWLIDYIYIPLGGNRCSKLRHLFNTLVVFIICGFWHGANWTFVFWGLYNGVLVTINKGEKKNNIKIDKNELNISVFFKISVTFILITLGWVVFRSENLLQALSFFKG